MSKFEEPYRRTIEIELVSSFPLDLVSQRQGFIHSPLIYKLSVGARQI